MRRGTVMRQEEKTNSLNQESKLIRRISSNEDLKRTSLEFSGFGTPIGDYLHIEPIIVKLLD